MAVSWTVAMSSGGTPQASRALTLALPAHVLVKALSPEVLHEVVHGCLQLHGGTGFMRGTPIERNFSATHSASGETHSSWASGRSDRSSVQTT